MATTRDYTVVVPFPLAGGHWAEAGDTVALLDVEAAQLLRVGRITLKTDVSEKDVKKNNTIK